MKKFVIPIALVAAALIVAFALYLVFTKQQSSTASGSGDVSALRAVGPTDHILGNPTAPVKIVEYADFDCTYCKQFDQVLHQIIDAYGASGKVAWVYRNFPLTELHPNALTHAEAAECVALTSGNATYWKFADSLFANQPVNPANYTALAQAAGAIVSSFSDCLANAATTVDPRISDDPANAIAIGALGTPYSIIEAPGVTPVVLPGATSYDNLKAALDSVLAQIK